MILIPQDKANHFIYGFLIHSIFSLLFKAIILTEVLQSTYIFIIANFKYSVLIIVILFALGKEIKDQINYKGFDYKDLLATMIPSIVLHFLK